MTAVKQRFCAKTGWTMILFVFYSSSHNFQSPTGKFTICKSSHTKIDLRFSYVNLSWISKNYSFFKMVSILSKKFCFRVLYFKLGSDSKFLKKFFLR
ncbi:hypothetical protein AYB34_06450 [Leptospira sp. ZV016]|nr:hypothetical protein AYB32_07565 [Leptospira kirschneri]KXZ25157.1 hypothetical protein AYB34_06450 [Leptospira sp. ZV016]